MTEIRVPLELIINLEVKAVTPGPERVSDSVTTVMTSMMTPDMISKKHRHYKRKKNPGKKKEKRAYHKRVPVVKNKTHVQKALEYAQAEGLSFVRAYNEMYNTNPNGDQQDQADLLRGRYSRIKSAKQDPEYAEKLRKDNEYMMQQLKDKETEHTYPCGICLTPDKVDKKGDICSECEKLIDEKNKADDSIPSKHRGPQKGVKRGPYKKRNKR